MEAVIVRGRLFLWVIGLTAVIGLAGFILASGFSKSQSSTQVAIPELQAEIPIQGKLVFSGFRHPSDHMLHLWIVDGRSIKHLGHRGIEPVLSKDGKDLFFKGQDGLYRMNLASGDMELLGISKVAWISHFDISPDGKEICFIAGETNEARGLKGFNVHIANIDGSGLRYITDFPRNDVHGANYPRWSPDGGQILFTAFDPSEPPGKRDVHLWRIHNDGSGLQKIMIDPSTENTKEPAWSPDGRSVTFAATPADASDHDNEIFVLDLASREIRQLTHNDWNEREPVFSPDGKQICFVSYRHQTVGAAGFGSELYLINTDGTNERRLTPPQKDEHHRALGGWAEDHHPTWAP